MAAMADPTHDMLEEAIKEARNFGYAQRAITELSQLSNTPDKERGSILSTAFAGINVFKNQAVKARTSFSDLQFKDLLKDYVGEYDETLKDKNIALANRNTLREIVRDYISDGDTRNSIALSQKEAKIASNYNKVAKYLSNFQLDMVSDDMGIITFNTNNEWGKRKITARFEGDTVECKIGNKWMNVESIPNLFKTSNLLKAYVNDNHVAMNNNKNVVISKRLFNEKLNDYATENDIAEFIKKLIDNKHIVQIASNMYASEYSFEELLSEFDGDVDETIKTDNLEKKNRLAGKEVSANYEEDGDTRNPQKQLSESEFKAQFEYMLPKHILCKDYKEISIDESIAKCTAMLFNKNNGLSALGTFDIAVKDGVLDSSLGKNVDSLFDLTTINKTFNRYNKEQRNAQKRIISKRYVNEKLNKIAFVGELDEVFNTWVKKGLAERIDSNNYATEYTLDELLAQSNILAYEDDEIKGKFEKASASRQLIPKQYHVQDSDSKSLANVEDGRTDEVFNQVKANCESKLNSMIEKGLITASRVEKFNEQLKEISTTFGLNEFNRELDRYMK
jgi:hypothetical protein